MRCHICNADSDSVTLDRRDNKFSPCSSCQEVIQDTVDGFATEVDEEAEDIMILENEETEQLMVRANYYDES